MGENRATLWVLCCFMVMANRRTLILGSVLAVLGIVLVVRYFMSDSVTLNFTNAPLAKIIKSIERQGHVRIVTNADPATTASIKVKRVPVYDAIDTLATRVDGDVRLAYIAAPDARKIDDALAAFSASSNPGGWTAFAAGFGGRSMVDNDAFDPRRIEWQISEMPDRNLQSFLNQGAQKTGVTFAVPSDWNPVLGSLPAGGNVGKMARAVIGSAKGNVKELFLLSVRPARTAGNGPPREGARDEGGGWGSVGASIFSPQRGNRGGMNMEWMAERAQAQIAQLPPEERAQAQQQFDEMRKLWASLRDLSPEERRAKMEEIMDKPEVQAAIDDRMAARDAKSSPEQRESRYRNYIQRKMAAKGSPASPK